MLNAFRVLARGLHLISTCKLKMRQQPSLLTNTHAFVSDAGYGRNVRLNRNLPAVHEHKNFWTQRSVINVDVG
jgi:hypothetical protein